MKSACSIRTGVMLFLIVMVAVVVLPVIQVHANGFVNPPAGAAAVGLDGARTALVNDPSAVSHNPANLAGMTEGHVLVGLDALHTEADFSSPLISTSTRDPWKLLPHAFAAWPINNEGTTAGIGISSPFGQSTEWNKNTPFPYHSEMILVDISPAFGAQVSENVKVGAALNLYASQLDIRQALPWAYLPGGRRSDAPGAVKLEGNGYGAGATLGASWEVAPSHTLAMHYRSQFDVEYSGDTDLTGIPSQFTGVLAPRSDFEADINFPNIINLGYGWQVNEDLRVGADIEWVEHTRNQSIPIDVGVNSAAGLFPPALPQGWKDNWNAGVAGAWRVSETVELRSGYKFLACPIPSDTLSPSLPDADKHMLTVGLGWQSGVHTVDTALTYAILDNRTVTDSYDPILNGEYEMDSLIMGLSYGYAF